MPSSRRLFKLIDAEIRRVHIAVMEHEVLDGPFDHTDLCPICYPPDLVMHPEKGETRDAFLRRVQSEVAARRATAAPNGEVPE